VYNREQVSSSIATVVVESSPSLSLQPSF